jgi:hypothetical protein
MVDLISEDSPMPEAIQQIQVERNPQGQFVKGQSGNPAGKPPGCRNQATRIAEALLDGGVEAVTRKVMEFALDGDPTAMRLCFDRIIAPRRTRPVHLDLPPIADAADIANAMAAVTAAVAAGAITPGRRSRGGNDCRNTPSGARGERLRETAEGAGSGACGGFLTPGSRGWPEARPRAN